MKSILLVKNMVSFSAFCGSAIRIQDGRITHIGEEDDILQLMDEDTQLYDFRKFCVTPGFIDAHSHILQTAQTIHLVSLKEAGSIAEIIERMKKKAASIEEGKWCIGFGYDHNFLTEKRHPLAKDLNEISTDIPVMVSHTSGHMGVVNDAALRLLKIDENTPDPQGGKIGRDAEGKPNGYLEETAFTQLGAMMQAPKEEEWEKQWKDAEELYLSYGITTAQDGYTQQDQLEVLKQLAAKKLIHLDVVSYPGHKEGGLKLIQKHPELENYWNHLRIGGTKIFLDGSPQGKTAWMETPYANDPDYFGYPIYSDEQVKQFVKEAMEAKQQLLCHCNGDAAAAQWIRCVQSQIDLGLDQDTRPVMIHAQLLRPDQLPALKKAHILPSFFVAHIYYWGDIHIANFTAKRAALISCAAAAQKLDIPFTFHQDTPVIEPNMLETIQCAAERKTKNGVVLGEDLRLSVHEALKAVTLNAAWQYHEEKEKGSLEPGKLADLVILSANPEECAIEEIKSIKVLATFKEGRCLWKAKDEADLAAI